MTKQKLISLIIKKQSYKQLKPTISQITKQNMQSVRHSVNAVQQILIKQYNAESKLYALRFLKDCFEAGSKKFIKSTSDDLLPIITNIVLDSTDEQAITKYAGSSFTKSTDLEKFKSIMVSFFKLAKQCIVKWAQWVSNPQFKFVTTYNSLIKKAVRFDGQFKYFRPENYINFQKNSKQNAFPLIVQNTQTIKTINDSKLPKQKSPSQIIKETQKNAESTAAKQKENTQQKIQLSKRYGPKSKNKFIIKCHQIFYTYDQKLKNGTMQQAQIEEMNSHINLQLQEYMGLPDLNQTQMESQLTVIFENIKNFKEDFAKLKTFNNAKKKEKEQMPQVKGKKLTVGKTQNINSNKKMETPQSPIHQLTVPGSQSPRGNTNKFQYSPSKQDFQRQTKNQKPQGGSIKKVESCKATKEAKVEKKKIQVFEDDTSIIQSEIKPSLANKIPIQNQRNNNNNINSSGKMITEKKALQQGPSSKDIKNPNNEQTVPIQRQVTKTTHKSRTSKQKFDSNIDFSRSQSSRVEFSESSGDEQSSKDQASRLIGNFRKQKTDPRLSSIIEDNRQHIENSSRRNFNESEHQSSKKQPKFKDQVVQKLSLNPNQIKIPKQAIDEYQNKIRTLQIHLREKQSRQKQLQKRLTELNTLKKVQQKQMINIRQENNKILQRFSNAVDPQQYAKIKNDFQQMKIRNKKMEGNMDRLNKQIQVLKVVHKQQNSVNLSSVNLQNKEKHIKTVPEPNNLFYESQNIPTTILTIKKPLEQQKPQSTYLPLDPDYIKNRTHFSKLHKFLDQNNLSLMKKNIIGASELFFNSEEMSLACRMTHFKNEQMALKLDLSLKFNGMNKRDVKPTVNIANLQEIQVWKKNITGQDFLYHQEMFVKLKNFPFKLLKMEVSTSQQNKQSVVLPFIYFSFLKQCQIGQEEFDSYFAENKDSAIKSKVFNLNSKIVKDFKSLHFYQGFLMAGDNRMYFKIYEKSQKNSFWCEITNLSKQKCIIKVIPEPFNEEMYTKAEQLMHNLIFLVGAN